MPKRLALLATVAALAVTPALAQQPTTTPSPSQPAPQAQPAPSGMPDKSFVNTQTANQWSASKLIGLRVTGSNNESIGDINDLLVDNTGNVIAAVIGVGGFLGIGAKDVAISFDAVDFMRDADGREQAKLAMTKEQLQSAPDFKPYQPPRPAARPTPGSPSTPKN